MEKHIQLRTGILLILLCVISLSMCLGCHWKNGGVSQGEASGPLIGKVVVAGFRPAMSSEEESGPVRDPLSGETYIAEPVDPAVALSLTSMLFDMLVEDKRYKLVSPGQARGVYAKVLESERGTGLDTAQIMQEVGRSFGADAVIWGYVYRWRERKGKDFGVESSASVAFDLRFTSPRDGTVLWRRMFGKTQQSLSENLLDLSTFIEGKGRWMTAEGLAKLGLKKMIEQMPPGRQEEPGSAEEEQL